MLVARQGRALRIALVCGFFSVLVIAQDERLPIRVPTDGAKWYGNDGMWSTMTIRLGDPTQIVYVLAGTGSSITTAVGSIWCNDPDSGYSCDDRGRSFVISESTTWKDIGQFELGLGEGLEQDYLKNTSKDYGFAEFGRDLIEIQSGEGRNKALKLQNQIIGVLNDTSQLVGTLGLGLRSRTFQGGNESDDRIPSFMSTLMNEKRIPSRSYGYQAGNFHRQRRTPMDLVLGGRNLGRYIESNRTYSLDKNQSPVLNLQDLTVSATGNPPWGAGSETLSLEPVLVTIDSTTPFLWLPEELCRRFERALSLTWNSDYNLYLMDNSTIYDGLSKLNMTFAFTFSSEAGSDDRVTINVPFNSLDLEISWPYVNTTDKIKYFPLKRSDDDTAYTLGRSFLQESYLIVDYERGNFSLHQALFPPKSDLVVEIPAPGNEPKPSPGSKSSSLSTGAIAAIAVGGAVFLSILALSFIFYRRRKSTKAAPSASSTNPTDPPPSEGIWEVYGDTMQKSPYGQGVATEMPAQERVSRTELPAVNFEPAELSEDTAPRKRFSWEEEQGGPPSPVFRNLDSPLLPKREGIELSPITPRSEGGSTGRPVSDLSPEGTMQSRGSSGMGVVSPITPHFPR